MKTQKILSRIALLCFIGFLISCSTAKKAERQEARAETFFRKHPEKLALKCATAFPVLDQTTEKDSISYDYQQPTDHYIIYDTVSVAGQPHIIQRACPTVQGIQVTHWKEKLVIRKDTAGLAVLQYTIADRNKELLNLSKKILEKDAQLEAKEAARKEAMQDKGRWIRYAVITWLLILIAAVLYALVRFKIL
jgi:hypothetical protein